MNTVRVLLLRLILGWWMIPCTWLINWPLGFLLFGPSVATENCMDVSYTLWFGELRPNASLTGGEAVRFKPLLGDTGEHG